MKIKNRYPRTGDRYTLYLKKIEIIRDISGFKFEYYGTNKTKKTNIIHSTGHGGGLHLKDYFIDKYAGTGRPLKVKFIRQTKNRFLYETVPMQKGEYHVLLYGEWLQEYPDNSFLENDLFEI